MAPLRHGTFAAAAYGLALVAASTSPATAQATLQPGDVVVLLGNGDVRRLDPSDGALEPVSGARLPDVFAIASDGVLFGTDLQLRTVVRIDVASGVSETVSSPLRGTGPLPTQRSFAKDLDLAPAGGDLWLEASPCCDIAIDPATGDRTALGLVDVTHLAFGPDGTGFATTESSSLCGHYTCQITESVLQIDSTEQSATAVLGPAVQTGTGFYDQAGIAVTPDGRVYTTVAGTDPNPPRVARIHPDLHVREAISGLGIGAGPDWGRPTTIVAASNEELLVFDAELDALVSVALANGDRTIVSGSGVGAGPALTDLIGVESDGTILAVSADGVMRVDATGGDRTLLLPAQLGAGPTASTSLVADPHSLFAVTGTAYSDERLLRIDAATGDRALARRSPVRRSAAGRSGTAPSTSRSVPTGSTCSTTTETSSASTRTAHAPSCRTPRRARATRSIQARWQ